MWERLGICKEGSEWIVKIRKGEREGGREIERERDREREGKGGGEGESSRD